MLILLDKHIESMVLLVMSMKKHIKMNKFGTADYYRDRAKERNSINGTSYYKGSDTPLVKKSLCKKCGSDIVWLTSKNGKSYPVNYLDEYRVISYDFHNCEEK